MTNVTTHDANVAAKSGLPSENASKAASQSMPQNFLAVFCRADSAYPAKHPRQVLPRFEAADHRDVQDTRAARDIPFALCSMTQNKVMRALAGVSERFG
jgi:hypothetical protein